MSSHDDPEARIRELERSLGDRAAELTQSSTEAGSAPTQSPYTAPLPPYQAPPPGYGVPPSYGVPFPPVPMSAGRGPGRGRLVVGLITMITVGIVAGAVYFFVNVFSNVSSLVDVFSTGPTVSGGGGPFGEQPSRSAANRPQITISEPTVASAPPGSLISVPGVGVNKTIECNDGIVSISGVSNIVVLTGHCVSVAVSGIENIVTVDAADMITASGFDNRVTYRSGSPDVQKSGSNVVEQG